ncbi:MAG TPA: hypothetical protein VGI67_20950 [Thermoleophilaceae bacterium]
MATRLHRFGDSFSCKTACKQPIRTLCAGCVLLAVLTAGCSRHTGSESAPAACTDGSPATRVATLRAALAHAPAPVRLGDGTSISDCLAHDADSGDIQNVGSMLLSVTQQIVDSARGPQDAKALLELGYLAGAVRRGAAHAQGVDGEIERRIDQELETVDTAAPSFARGERAGRASG